MPEYLAPAVYVEEVDTGSKPIEGVSTSTCGVVGVTERGPVNVPILVTSYGEYQRWFGGRLSRDLYGEHRYVPNAMDGFFTNGGKRVYVTRVLDPTAARAASRSLVAKPNAAAPAVESQLLFDAKPNDAAVLVADGSGFNVGEQVQIGTGLNAELQAIDSLIAAHTLALRLPLAFPHASGSTISAANIASTETRRVLAGFNQAVDTIPMALPVALNAGDEVSIEINNISRTFVIKTTGNADSIVLTDTPPSAPTSPDVTFTHLPGNLASASKIGQTSITTEKAFAVLAGDLIAIGAGDAEELARVSAASAGISIQLEAALQLPHAAAAQVARQVPTISALPTIAQGFDAAVGDTVVVLAGAIGNPLAIVVFESGNKKEYRRVGILQQLDLGCAPYADYPAGARVENLGPPNAAPANPPKLSADAKLGINRIKVSDRTAMSPDKVIAIANGTDTEFAVIAGVDSPSGQVSPDPGFISLHAPLRNDFGATSSVYPITTLAAVASPATMALKSDAGAQGIIVSAGTAIAAGDLLRIIPAAGGPFYHEVSSVHAVPQPMSVSFGAGRKLSGSHSAGTSFAVRTPILEVRALDAGQWGNRLRVAMEAQDPPGFTPLVNTRVRDVLPGNLIKLDSASGVEKGTELIVSGIASSSRVKVAGIDRQNDYLITLDPTTPLGGATRGDSVRSVEYRLVVELLRQPDAANPSRNNNPIDREVFAGLSLDPSHSRYFQRVIGSTWDMVNPTTTQDDSSQTLRLADRRSEGESAYIRVRDLAPGSGLRAGPQADYELRPGSPPRLILLPLGNGDDDIGSLVEDTYIGKDDPNPELRTGLQTLRNIEEISVVAAPGRTSTPMQNALINHCELMRYRFAVLDAVAPPKDSMSDVQAQRQQFDTKYAALYHPWLLIPDPYPATAGTVPDYPVPPAGHMLGVYARTDIERGVHKAPANEVVRGITGLQRLLNKEQQDILNPYPVNINVIRDFRHNNRGIRVYGGRCITSDSDWKYVNVRRLMIFIEASIDRGLQWVVFEPNAEPLWARVVRSVSNFLRQVWRNGALEGTKPEEAFFVKCDRTTMTQTDIDQGRLICLVGVAPVKPAEFVIVRIGLWTAHADE